MADVLVLLLLEDGGYVLQEDADLSGSGDGRIILAEIPIFAKACESDFPLVFSVPVSPGPRIADLPLLLLPRPPQDLPAQASPSPAAPAPRVGVKSCSSALPIDPALTWGRT